MTNIFDIPITDGVLCDMHCSWWDNGSLDEAQEEDLGEQAAQQMGIWEVSLNNHYQSNLDWTIWADILAV